MKVPIVNDNHVTIHIEFNLGRHFDLMDGTIMMNVIAKGGNLFTLSATCGLRIGCKYASGVIHKGS
jgi:hypothetical protein